MNSKIIYSGAFEAVTIVDPATGREFKCARGEVATMPTAVAARVAYQSSADFKGEGENGAHAPEVAAAIAELKATLEPQPETAPEAAAPVTPPADANPQS